MISRVRRASVNSRSVMDRVTGGASGAAEREPRRRGADRRRRRRRIMTGGGAGGREWIRFCGVGCNRALRGGTG